MTQRSPEIIEVDTRQIEELLERAESNSLRGEDTQLMRTILESYVEFFRIVGDRNTTIARLRKMLFGSASEKSRNVLDAGRQGEAEEESQSAVAATGQGGEQKGEDTPAAPPGHGRHRAGNYRGAEQVTVNHPALSPGDRCPECDQGTLYQKPPGVLVRFVGQAPVGATVYHLEKLRCGTCGKTFTAPAPEEAGSAKYDHTAASMIGLMKYGSGLPFNRLQRLQGNCGIPLAASTQWSIVQAGAMLMVPAWEELVRQAAQGEVLHNDDTTIKILELMQQGKNPLSGDAGDPHAPARTGLFTSGIVSTRDGLRMALFFSGRRHAGENLADVLRHRAAERDAPLQMCDGLSRNLPGELETIVANCLAHARRNFVELVDRFPEECEHVIREFGVIYRNDQVARQQQMSAARRLAWHQLHSQPVMDSLKAWLEQQLDDRLTEPNSALGKAIRYMLTRWAPLTLFLREAGAPLDNNICERALKKCILHRRNSLFYKTQGGARVADLYMSLIYTCELNGVSAFDYLNQLQLHSADVARHPDRWMPWNFQDQPANPAAA